MPAAISGQARPRWMQDLAAPWQPPLVNPPRQQQWMMAAFCLAVTGFLAGVAAWYRPLQSPYFVPLWITQYRSPLLAHRGGADQDREAIESAGIFPDFADTYTTQESGLVLREIQQLAMLPHRNRQVVYVSGYAVPAEQDDIVILPADAEPPNHTQGLSLAQLIRIMQQSSAREKLLILDVSPPPLRGQAGYLLQTSALDIPRLFRRLQNEFAEYHPGKSDQLQILLSAEPGQQSHSSMILGRTIFGFYLEEGLRGAALPWSAANRQKSRRITVTSLSRYLRARVDRWVRENHGARQTPLLLGAGPDFDLAAAASTFTPNPTPAADSSQFAAVLAGWQTLEQWRNDRSISIAPRIYHQLQARVQAAQISIRLGGINATTAAVLQDDLNFYRQQMMVAKNAARYPSQGGTFAFAQQAGLQPDPQLQAAVDQFLSGIQMLANSKPADREATLAKLIQAILKETAEQSRESVEAAVLSRASLLVRQPSQLTAIQQFLTARNQPFIYLETRFLDKLATLAKSMPEANWPADDMARAVEAVLQTEAACARPWLFRWARPVLDACVRARWEAESLLDVWSLVPAEAIFTRFSEAHQLSRRLLTFSESWQQARGAADESLLTLLPKIDWLVENPEGLTLWHNRLQATAQLLPLLEPPPQPLDPIALQSLSDRLQSFTEQLLNETRAFDRISGGADTTWILQSAKRDSADGTLVPAIDNILSLPLLPSQTREAFRAASTELAQRLNNRTREKDAQDDENYVLTPEITYTAAESQSDQHRDRIRAGLHASCQLAVLELIGLPATERTVLARLISRARNDQLSQPEWRELGHRLAQAWINSWPANSGTASSSQLDRISILYPGFLNLPLLDNTPGGPRVSDRRNDWQQAFTWLASVYLRAARASTDADFLHRLAETTASAGQGLVTLTEIRVASPITPVVLTADKPVGNIVLPLVIPASIIEPPTIRLFHRPESLDIQIEPEPIRSKPDGTDRLTEVRIQVRPQPAAILTALPEALILEIASRDWSQFVKIPLDSSRLIRTVAVEISRDPQTLAALGDQAIFRPGTPQPLYVVLHNLRNEPRQFAVQVTSVPSSEWQMETKVALGPSEKKIVPFTAASSPKVAATTTASATTASGATATLPSMTRLALPATLRVRVLEDNKTQELLLERDFRLLLAHPSTYVDLSDALFIPSQPSTRPLNRFQVALRARQDLGTTPSHAKLILDPQNIPGFRGLQSGRLAGQIPPSGQLLTLDANGLLLSPESPRLGQVTLTIDGVERAFRLQVDFARFGEPTTPRVDSSPRLLLRLADSPQPGRSLAFHVDADHAPSNATIDVRLLRGEAPEHGVVERQQIFPAARHQQATLAAGDPQGGLVFHGAISSWSATWELPQLIGRRLLQARLRDAQGHILQTRELPIFLDDTPADAVEFRNPPSTALHSGPLTLRVFASDRESGIREVSFFVGKPIDGKLPPGVIEIPGTPASDEPMTWIGIMPPQQNRGPTDYTVKIVNGAGLTRYLTTSILLVDRLPSPPGVITGTVLLGSIPQPGLPVTLADANGKPLLKTTTNSQGIYVFPELKAGTYQLSSQSLNPPRTATATVHVTAGATTTQDLSLYLRANASQ